MILKLAFTLLVFLVFLVALSFPMKRKLNHVQMAYDIIADARTDCNTGELNMTAVRDDMHRLMSQVDPNHGDKEKAAAMFKTIAAKWTNQNKLGRSNQEKDLFTTFVEDATDGQVNKFGDVAQVKHGFFSSESVFR